MFLYLIQFVFLDRAQAARNKKAYKDFREGHISEGGWYLGSTGDWSRWKSSHRLYLKSGARSVATVWYHPRYKRKTVEKVHEPACRDMLDAGLHPVDVTSYLVGLGYVTRSIELYTSE